ncbi:MAG: glycosyltransferase [Planctomycetes bacterium]|nr:glycosyltransferase [Planctomycetota bacterium]
MAQGGGGAEVSILIPAYNESGRLDPFARDLASFLRAWAVPHEVLWIDDGSVDDTAAKIAALCEAHGTQERPWRLVRQETNRGKGAAVQRGVRESRGGAVLFLDADGATSPDQIPALLAALERAPFAVGDRNHPSSRTLQPPLRRLTSWGFNLCTRMILGTEVRDHLCGFKALRTDEARRLFERLSDPRWTFDAELLWRARKARIEVVAIPITWNHREGTKLRPLDPLWMLGRLVRLRLTG